MSRGTSSAPRRHMGARHSGLWLNRCCAGRLRVGGLRSSWHTPAGVLLRSSKLNESSSAPSRGHGIRIASPGAGRADMKNHALVFVALAAISAVGVALNSRSATAETAPSTASSQIWQLGVASGNPGPAAWRLNTATGFMELCSDAGGTPRCEAMPAPGAAASAPKGLLVPAPSGR